MMQSACPTLCQAVPSRVLVACLFFSLNISVNSTLYACLMPAQLRQVSLHTGLTVVGVQKSEIKCKSITNTKFQTLFEMS